MNERNEYLIYLYHICEMGVSSTKSLLDLLKKTDNKITRIIEDELDEYNKVYKEVKELLASKGIKEPKSGLLAKSGIALSMHQELMKDNSDTHVADMLIQGYTMGNLELNKKYSKYKDSISKEEERITETIRKFQDRNINTLKSYL